MEGCLATRTQWLEWSDILVSRLSSTTTMPYRLAFAEGARSTAKSQGYRTTTDE